MIPDDYLPRINFAHWYLQQNSVNKTLFADVLFSDETTLMRSEMFNMFNSYLWAHYSMHSTITHAYQEIISISLDRHCAQKLSRPVHST